MNPNRFAIAFALLVVIGCSGIQVNQDYDPATDFSGLRTYRWETPVQASTGDPRIDNPLQDARIRQAVDRNLHTKGYTLASDNAPATFSVRYQYLLRQRIESDGTRGRVGFGIGSYGRHGGIAIGTGDSVREYDEGSLIIDFWDTDRNTLLWRGNGVHRYRTYNDPNKAKRDIDQLVEKILEQFPPRQ
jgi:hypothetical protein